MYLVSTGVLWKINRIKLKGVEMSVEEIKLFGGIMRVDKERCPWNEGENIEITSSCMLCVSMKCNKNMEKEKYCPCCKEKFPSQEEFCFLCGLPLLDYIPRTKNTCNCEEYPIGRDVTVKAKGGLKTFATTEILNISGIKNPAEAEDYMDALMLFNKE